MAKKIFSLSEIEDTDMIMEMLKRGYTVSRR